MCVCGIGDEQHIANLGGKQRGTRGEPGLDLGGNLGWTWAGPGKKTAILGLITKTIKQTN